MGKREDVAALLLNRQYNGALTADADAFYEGRTADEQDDALATADAIIALVEKAEYDPAASMGRWYDTKEDHW